MVTEAETRTEWVIQYTSSIGEWLRAGKAITPDEARTKLRRFREHHERAYGQQRVNPVSYRAVERCVTEKVLDW